MIPSSTIWTIHHSANILVYPLSWYDVKSGRKSPTDRRTSTGRRYRTTRSGHGRRADARDAFGRRHQVRPRRRRRLRQQDQQQQRDETSPCPSSLSTSSATASGSLRRRRRRSSPSSHGRSTSDEGQRRGAAHARGDGAVGPGGPRDGAARRRRRHVRGHLGRRLREKITSSRPSVGHVKSGEARDGGGRRSFADDDRGRGDDGPATLRCSANVVLLAHGYRSLHVLVVQRSQTRYFHVDPVTTVSTAVRYKLPGGKFLMTDEEQENYLQEDRNVCCCPDDERWYARALEHFLTTRPPTKVLPYSQSSLSPSSTTRTSIDSQSPPPPPPPQPLPNEHHHRGTDATRQPFVPLGKWYRTQDKKSRERDGGCDATAAGCHAPHSWNYYPYKPAHVSRQAAEEKRLYGVLDARCLFAAGGGGGGGGRQPTFRVPTPRAKAKTVERPDGSVVYKTTAYKCKFVPLARLHENVRTYGPILSSLPVVVSSMNLIYLP